MSKYPTFPTLLEECCSFAISDLNRLDCLAPSSRINTVTLSWKKGENFYLQAIITVYDQLDKQFITIEYKDGYERIKQTIELFSMTSNIGKGLVWFFICPLTGKRCRKLYLINDHFVHRAAFSGCIYANQSYSHNKRKYYGLLDKLKRIKNDLNNIYKPKFRHEYDGKPTKRFLKIRRLIEAEKEISKTLNMIVSQKSGLIAINKLNIHSTQSG